MFLIGKLFKEDRTWAAFLAFALLSMLSMQLARAFCVLVLIFALFDKTYRKRFVITPPALGWLSYLAIAIVISGILSLTIDDPLLQTVKGFKKLPKLMWFLAIPISVMVVSTKERLNTTLKVLSLGSIVLALWVIIIHPFYAWLQVSFPLPGETASGLAGFLGKTASFFGLQETISNGLMDKVWKYGGARPPDFHQAFTYLGKMDDAQRLMTGLIISTCLFTCDRSGVVSAKRKKIFEILAIAIITIGLILTCKRGPILIGSAVSLAILAVRIKPYKTILAFVFLVFAIIATPSVRQRIAELPSEFEVQKGGRALMWTKIVPELHREYPYGIGFRSLTARKMRSITKGIERNRTHVHSVPLQAFVDFGYIGICTWLFWMVITFVSALKPILTDWQTSKKCATILAPFAAFVGLFAFGFVEYNIADASVVLLFSIILALCGPRVQ